jgi:hypothetical protein
MQILPLSIPKANRNARRNSIAISRFLMTAPRDGQQTRRQLYYWANLNILSP